VGGRADGQPSDIVRENSLEEVVTGRVSDAEALRLITDRVAQVAARSRESAEQLENVDAVSQSICLDVARALEKASPTSSKSEWSGSTTSRLRRPKRRSGA
jgi:DNA-binding ferritin-like protein